MSQNQHPTRAAAGSIATTLTDANKLAFAGPDATKWTYNVMPFGPVNGPATFIAFIHDMDSTWKALAAEHGITINEDTNPNIIVDDILSWALSEAAALLYI